jgi:hypothetical protein
MNGLLKFKKKNARIQAEALTSSLLLKTKENKHKPKRFHGERSNNVPSTLTFRGDSRPFSVRKERPSILLIG